MRDLEKFKKALFSGDGGVTALLAFKKESPFLTKLFLGKRSLYHNGSEIDLISPDLKIAIF